LKQQPLPLRLEEPMLRFLLGPHYSSIPILHGSIALKEHFLPTGRQAFEEHSANAPFEERPHWLEVGGRILKTSLLKAHKGRSYTIFFCDILSLIADC
jgi:hypothetical protein